MIRSDAQKVADKRYEEARKGAYITWSVRIKPEEIVEINRILKEHNLTRVAFLRLALEKMK